MSEELSHIQPKQPVYIEGVGWRNPVEHCMTRWPYWKDARTFECFDYPEEMAELVKKAKCEG